MEKMKYDSILQAIKDHSLCTPEKVALADKKKEVTYHQLWLQIQKVASYLKEKGISKGQIVVLQGSQKIDFFITIFAIQFLGGIACPIEKSAQENKVKEIMKLVDSLFYISEKPLEDNSFSNLIFHNIMESSMMDKEVLYDGQLPNSDSLAEILFTTGTTGKSKGIEITIGCDISIVENVIDSVKMTECEVEMLTTPVNHSLALRRTYAAMYIGSSAIISDGFKFANTFFGLLDKYKVTAITLVPAIFEQMILYDQKKFSSYNSQLHYIQFGSANLSEDNKKKATEMFPDVRLYNTYGATESACTVILEFSKYPKRNGCIGRTTINTELIVVDDNRNPITSSKENPGIFAFKGGMNMKGYYKDSDETKLAMDEEGVVYTNDVGYIGEDGFVYLIGRQGDVINMGGIKIAPTEIEEVAAKHPMVADCACIPIKDTITGEAPKLFVQVSPDSIFDPVELEKYLRSNIEGNKVPKEYERIDKIPRTFNGKIIRKVLKEKQNERTD